ncbi:hypothetical protein Pla108_14360 [Botrimarina colliarenosi]|uniref:VWFA domain-containing protein n=1 Tax=Botrimarina colliarenosi TaxID=2528001 RepID=A0A5C6AKB2_9BACT|nr:hypothetical protein [Botrimarina colliarenosi]TWU00485.1 hypothetical protein Pla108_14360 [Botrimarina colliarenosi]
MNVFTLTRRLFWATLVAALSGCCAPALAAPTVERFYFIADELDPAPRQAAYRAVTRLLTETAVPGEYVTIVATPAHTPIATLAVPAGSKTVRLRKPAIRPQVRALAAFFEKKGAGGSTQAEPQKIATTVRSLRRTELPLKIVVVADPVYRNDDYPTWSMTGGKVPCDGSVFVDYSPWRVTQKLPKNTSVAWMTPTAGFGDDLFHQEAITRWHRRYLLALGGSLDCVTPNADLAFNYAGSQFGEPLGKLEDAAGMRSVVSVAETVEPVVIPAPAIQPPVTAPVIEEPSIDVQVPAAPAPATALPIDWCDTPPSALDALRGDLRHVVFLRDLSRSMIESIDGEDCSDVNAAVLRDMNEKLSGIACERFAVIGFGGEGTVGSVVRLCRHPSLFWRPVWATATPQSRQAASRAVARWEVRGGTSTLAALQEVRRLDGVTSVILWSDGLPSIGTGADTQREVLDLVRELGAEGIVINTIGAGNLSGRGGGTLDLEGCQFLKEIADLTGGAYLAL